VIKPGNFTSRIPRRHLPIQFKKAGLYLSVQCLQFAFLDNARNFYGITGSHRFSPMGRIGECAGSKKSANAQYQNKKQTKDHLRDFFSVHVNARGHKIFR